MPATDIEALMDYEQPVLTMLAYLFATAGVSVYTPANAGFATDEWREANPDLTDYVLNAEEDLQRARPRVEIILSGGEATTFMSPPADGQTFAQLRCAAFEGTLQVSLITDYNYVKHCAYRAKVRRIMGDEFPCTYTPYHTINKCVPSGNSPEYKGEDNEMISAMNYSVHLNINPDAWPS